MNKPMTKQEWLSYLERTWDAAQKEAWGEQPRREWVGLTDEEKMAALVSVDAETKRLPPGFRDYARAIEAKLREKNT